MGSLGVTRERTQARFQGALSGNHEWAHCDAPCGLLNIAWLIQILKSPQRSYQPEMYGSIDAKCVFTRSCISCFRHLASLSFRPFCREVALCFSRGTNVSLVPVTPVIDPAQLVTPIPLCWSHTPNHILEVYFLFKCVAKEVWILLPVLSTV